MTDAPTMSELWMAVLSCLASYSTTTNEVLNVIQNGPVMDIFGFGTYGQQKVLIVHLPGTLIVAFMGSISKQCAISDFNQFCNDWLGTNLNTKEAMIQETKSPVFSGMLIKSAAVSLDELARLINDLILSHSLTKVLLCGKTTSVIITPPPSSQ